MPQTVTVSKRTVTRTNPFDDLVEETVIEVYEIRVDDTLLPSEKMDFPNGTSDSTIQTKVEDYLRGKGIIA